MGLTSWKGTKVRRGDVTVAKNYMDEEEIRNLNRIITMYLDYAEVQAERRHPVYMRDWVQKMDAFLQFNEQEILTGYGQVSMEVAKKLAIEEYEKFSRGRIAEEDADADEEFERTFRELEQGGDEG
jgi:hypothetical protein